MLRLRRQSIGPREAAMSWSRCSGDRRCRRRCAKPPSWAVRARANINSNTVPTSSSNSAALLPRLVTVGRSRPAPPTLPLSRDTLPPLLAGADAATPIAPTHTPALARSLPRRLRIQFPPFLRRHGRGRDHSRALDHGRDHGRGRNSGPKAPGHMSEPDPRRPPRPQRQTAPSPCIPTRPARPPIDPGWYLVPSRALAPILGRTLPRRLLRLRLRPCTEA